MNKNVEMKMNPRNKTGIKIIGFGALYNERELIEGWLKTLRFFCDEVWALYDPCSDDGTIEYLKEHEEKYKNTEVPLYLYKQDLTLGDSTRDEKGKQGKITFLANANKFLDEHVTFGTWTMWLAADERLEVSRSEDIYEALIFAEGMGANAVKFKFYDIYKNLDTYVNYDYLNLNLAHRKLIRNTPEYRYNLELHKGHNGGKPWVNTDLPFYHFGNFYKQDRNWWRDVNGVKYLDRIPKQKQLMKFKSPWLNKDWKCDA